MFNRNAIQNCVNYVSITIVGEACVVSILVGEARVRLDFVKVQDTTLIQD